MHFPARSGGSGGDRGKGAGAGLSGGDKGDGAMGDAPSPEEKLHLITRNLQVGPWSWKRIVGDWGSEVQRSGAPPRDLKCMGWGLRAKAAMREPAVLTAGRSVISQ